jgi:hypothetical protein
LRSELFLALTNCFPQPALVLRRLARLPVVCQFESHEVFTLHAILIEGHNLRRIEIAMQKGELPFVAKLSKNYHPLVNQGPRFLKLW